MSDGGQSAFPLPRSLQAEHRQHTALRRRKRLMLHSFAAVALIVVIMVHIYAALWVKGTITAMVEGWVTSAWAKKHHPRWYREVRKTTEKKAE